MKRRASTALAAALGAGCLTVVVGPAAPAGAVGDTCESVTSVDTERVERPDPSQPVADLRIEEAHRLLRDAGAGPGRGAVVAVVDSGVAASAVPVLRAFTLTQTGELQDPRGTAVGGIIVGPEDRDDVVGLAPEASLVDVRVYDNLTPEDAEVGPGPDAVADGLRLLARNHRDLGTDVAVVPVPVAKTDTLEAAVGALTRKGVIVVAAAGDRPTEEGQPLYDDYAPDQDDEGGEDGEDAEGSGTSARPAGEDARRDAWPAGSDDPLVVAVSTTVPEGQEPTDVVLQNSAIDVAVPTAGAVGYGMNRKTCVVSGPSTSWAAAEVAGVLALLRSAYRKDSPEQLLARLYQTATGSGEKTANNVLTGYGVVQPVEALTRPLRPDRRGRVDASEVVDRDAGPVAVPESEPDLLADIREDALWWGLIGGGALLVALVLRPVLSRRR